MNRNAIIVIVTFFLIVDLAFAQNPIVPDVGMADPHIKIYNNKSGFNISIKATTICMGPCITRPNPLVFEGYHKFNFIP